MTLRWQTDGADHLLRSSFPVLGRRGPRIGPAGIEAGVVWRRTWAWPDIVAVSWDLNEEGAPSLAVCIRHDPWVKELPVVAWWRGSWGDWRSLLEAVRPVVEQMGARLENREEPATHWWYLDPKAKRRLR